MALGSGFMVEHLHSPRLKPLAFPVKNISEADVENANLWKSGLNTPCAHMVFEHSMSFTLSHCVKQLNMSPWWLEHGFGTLSRVAMTT